MNNCDFCGKILSFNEFFDITNEMEDEEFFGIYNCITISNNEFYLSSFAGVDDVFFNLDDSMKIYYCPLCGRKLEVEDDETKQ